MGYYELYNRGAAPTNELMHGEPGAYELYHHGVKGQKWGVRRERKRAAKKKARYDAAEQRIKAHGTKSAAALSRMGIGTLRYLGQNWLASGAATATLSIAMNAVAPPVAATAFVATTAIALANTGLNIENIYKTGRDVYDIAKHSDDSDYLEHHGIKGQRWGVRRFQDESGALTGLGKQRANLDADWHPPKKV